MGSSIEYRECGFEDVVDLAQVTSDTMRECGLETPDIHDVERLKGRWAGYIRREQNPQHALEPRILYGAYAGGRMVGYVAGHWSRRHGTEGELQSIYVRKDYQHQGIGTALLERLAEWFNSCGRRRVCVGVSPQNLYQTFYLKHGARYLNEHWLIWEHVGSICERERNPKLS